MTKLWLSVVVVALAGIAAAQQYTVVDLGNFGGTGNGSAAGLSSNGLATGDADITALTSQAFYWSQGTGIVQIGNFAANPNGQSYGAGVNASGMVVGYGVSTTNGPYHGFYWTPSGGIHDLGTFAGGTGSQALGVNDSGMVVGTADKPGVAFAPFIWTQSGGMVSIGGFNGPNTTGVAACVNRVGQVGGTSTVVPGSYAHGFVWTQGQGFTEIGDFAGGNQDSHVHGINDSGDAVGEATFRLANGSRTTVAFYWARTGGLVNLGGLNTAAPNDVAEGINNHGQVVGWGFTGAGGDLGWIWSQGQGMRSMDSLLDSGSAANWTIISCQAINDDGVIAAQAFHGAAGGGRYAPVLLVPVPEPASLLCLAGLAGWFMRRRK